MNDDLVKWARSTQSFCSSDWPRLKAMADRIEALESRLAGETLAADSLFQKYRQAKSDLLKARREALEEAARVADDVLLPHGLDLTADMVTAAIRALKGSPSQHEGTAAKAEHDEG